MHYFDRFYALFHALFFAQTPTVWCTPSVSEKRTPHRYTVGVTASLGHPMQKSIICVYMLNHHRVTIRVAASERKSIGSPSVSHRWKQFCDLILIRRIELDLYFEIPIQFNKSSVFDLVFYAVMCNLFL